MEGWKKWMGKKVFLRTNNNRVYSGVVQEVEDVGDDLFFISIIDKFGKWMTVVNKEIVEIKEEDNNGHT